MAQQAQRRLAAVIAADVVGYTRLMQVNEENTINNWWAYRREIIDPVIAEFGGRIVKLTGDGFLAEFASVTNAVLAAYGMQKRIEHRASDTPAAERMLFRMGVNIGDIFWDDEDIYGDGVNIAARLEGIADPGTVLVSQSVFDQVKRTAQLSFEDRGKQSLKNIAEPVQAYRVVGELNSHSFISGDPDTLINQQSRQAPPNSLLVLPFNVLGNDLEQAYFADGFTEDLITELSRFSGLFVTARNVSFSLKDQPYDLQQIGHQFGVAYCLHGSVRRMAERIRITGQLIDATSHKTVWAEKYDTRIEALFDVQDQLAWSIASMVAGRMEHQSMEAARNKKPADMLSYECLLRGLEFHRLGGVTREAAEQALHWFNLAIDKDPNYGRAHAWRACALDGLAAWTEDDYYDEELGAATRALELDDNDAETHRILGSIYLSRRESDKTEYHFRRALALNPNSPWILGRIGELYNFQGDANKALEYQSRASQLDPLLPTYCREIEAVAHYVNADYSDTIRVASQLLRKSRRVCTYQVAALTHLDDPKALKQALDELLSIYPNITIGKFLDAEYYLRDEIPQRLTRDLEKAGIPR